MDGDILKYESYTAIGELYDAFEIIKNGKGPNRFVELKHQAISGRYFDNTISYTDELPLELRNVVLEKFPEAKINGINLKEDENGRLMYYLVIYQNELRSEIIIDEEGNIMME